ncbi:MAG: hypothetical protein RL324_1375 [Verrucomicrobiota bacterium]|jgi:hypothetical protein
MPQEKQRAADPENSKSQKVSGLAQSAAKPGPDFLTADYPDGTDGNSIPRQFHRKTRRSRRMPE